MDWPPPPIWLLWRLDLNGLGLDLTSIKVATSLQKIDPSLDSPPMDVDANGCWPYGPGAQVAQLASLLLAEFGDHDGKWEEGSV